MTESDLDAVIDVTGFAFGDEWADSPLGRRARNYERWRFRGVPVYMLPQAFGPFRSTAAPSKLAIESARLVYARDADSLDYVSKLFDGQMPHGVRLAPDFTVSVPGIFPEQYRSLAGGGRDRAQLEHPRTGLGRGGLHKGVHRQPRRGRPRPPCERSRRLRPLPRSAKDRRLLELVRARVPDLEIVSGLDGGVRSKGLIGASRLIVAGRYHALVSGLAQGIPSILHGWSHKYRWLAKDYDVEALASDPFAEPGELGALIEQTLGRPELPRRISTAARGVQARTAQMWSEIATDFAATAGSEGQAESSSVRRIGAAG